MVRMARVFDHVQYSFNPVSTGARSSTNSSGVYRTPFNTIPFSAAKGKNTKPENVKNDDNKPSGRSHRLKLNRVGSTIASVVMVALLYSDMIGTPFVSILVGRITTILGLVLVSMPLTTGTQRWVHYLITGLFSVLVIYCLRNSHLAHDNIFMVDFSKKISLINIGLLFLFPLISEELNYTYVTSMNKLQYTKELEK